MTYEELLCECECMDIEVIEKRFKSNVDGLCVGNLIAINSQLDINSKLGILAEEIGHFLTTEGDIIDLDTVSKRQCENKARKFAHELVIGLDGLVSAYENGCTDIYDAAEFLNVSTEFLQEAIYQYQLTFGAEKRYGDYIIRFSPNISITKITETE